MWSTLALVADGLLRPFQRPKLHREIFDDYAHMHVEALVGSVVVPMPRLDKEGGAIHLKRVLSDGVIAVRRLVEVHEEVLRVVVRDA